MAPADHRDVAQGNGCDPGPPPRSTAAVGRPFPGCWHAGRSLDVKENVSLERKKLREDPGGSCGPDGNPIDRAAATFTKTGPTPRTFRQGCKGAPRVRLEGRSPVPAYAALQSAARLGETKTKRRATGGLKQENVPVARLFQRPAQQKWSKERPGNWAAVPSAIQSLSRGLGQRNSVALRIHPSNDPRS